MGYRKHHAIIVSSWNRDAISEVNSHAVTIFDSAVSGLVRSAINDQYSFFIGPDGASENWSESNDGDFKRFEFLTYLQNYCNADGSSAIKWVELSYADDKAKAKIIDHN